MASITSRPSKKEIKLLEKILKSQIMMGKPLPNICISVYKNRGGEFNQIKIWLYVDYDTMRVHDLFCTDYDYAIIDIPQTYTEVIEDQKLTRTNSKEEIGTKKPQKDSEDSEENTDEEEGPDSPSLPDTVPPVAGEAMEAFQLSTTTEAFETAIDTGAIEELEYEEEDEENGEDKEESFNVLKAMSSPEYQNFDY